MNRTRRSSSMLLGVTILALAIGGINAAAVAQAPGLSAPIEGSWIFTITGTQDPTFLHRCIFVCCWWRLRGNRFE
jgi:hypothetical protein